MLSNYPALRPSLLLDFINHQAVDPRVTFIRHSRATAFDARGQLRTFDANAPRIDYDPATLACRGLLIEEQRTNSLANNTSQGTMAGTPGTTPTGWVVTGAANGLTREIVGTGTEAGVTYIEIRWAGTTTSSGTLQVIPAGTTAVAAASGQTWTGSFYLRLQAGSLANVSCAVHLTERNSAGGTLLTAGTTIAPTGAGLAAQRVAHTRTLTETAAAFVTPELRFTYESGVAIDVTLRVGLPQLELGAFATSVIATTTAAATRAADICSISTATSWYQTAAGSVAVEYSVPSSRASVNVLTFGDGTANERMIASGNSALAGASWRVVDNGIDQCDISRTAALSLGEITNIGAAYAQNDFAISLNGSALSTDGTGTVPTVSQLYLGSNGVNAQGSLHMRRLAYYPVRLPNAALQALTA